VRGIDAQIDYRLPLPGALEMNGEPASLTLQAVASWLLERSTRVLASSAAQDCSGFYGGGCSSGTGGFITPDFKLNLTGTYSTGPLSWRVQGRMIGGLDAYRTVVTTIDEIKPVWYVDTTLSFDVSEQFNLFGGVENLLDKQPPIFGTQFVGDANTDVSLYDTLGRRFFIGGRLRF
jgi:outer membrane receptor protein involved in Fe transport